LLRVSTASPGAQLSVPASRRKPLVISEWFFNTGRVPGVGTYSYGGYIELYNNADTTVFLDGLRVGDILAPIRPATNDAGERRAGPGAARSGESVG